MTKKRAIKLLMAHTNAGRNGANFIVCAKKIAVSNAQCIASVFDFCAIHNCLSSDVYFSKGDWKNYSILIIN